jgi:hypothetical protein
MKTNNKQNDKEVKTKKPKKEKADPHLGCASWPNCDIDPLGCRLEMGDDVEEYGMRD